MLLLISLSAFTFTQSLPAAAPCALIAVLDSCADDGIAVLAASPFSGGCFFSDGGGIIMGGFLPGCVVFSDTGDYDVLEIGAWVAMQD